MLGPRAIDFLGVGHGEGGRTIYANPRTLRKSRKKAHETKSKWHSYSMFPLPSPRPGIVCKSNPLSEKQRHAKKRRNLLHKGFDPDNKGMEFSCYLGKIHCLPRRSELPYCLIIHSSNSAFYWWWLPASDGPRDTMGFIANIFSWETYHVWEVWSLMSWVFNL